MPFLQWAQEMILKFADENGGICYAELTKKHADWIHTELVQPDPDGLREFLVQQFRQVDNNLAALVRRVDVIAPFFPLTKAERLVLAETLLRDTFGRYLEPAVSVKPGSSK